MNDFKLKTHADFQDVKVYWCAQQVSFFFGGNHHYLAFITRGIIPTSPAEFREVKGYKFQTISINGNSNMALVANDSGDIKGVESWLNGSIYNRFQLNEISPPSGSGLQFANKIIEIAKNYNKNVSARPLVWHISELNCASVVNSVLKHAGVPQNIRTKAGDFKYVDWGEDVEINDSYFR